MSFHAHHTYFVHNLNGNLKNVDLEKLLQKTIAKIRNCKKGKGKKKNQITASTRLQIQFHTLQYSSKF